MKKPRFRGLAAVIHSAVVTSAIHASLLHTLLKIHILPSHNQGSVCVQLIRYHRLTSAVISLPDAYMFSNPILKLHVRVFLFSKNLIGSSFSITYSLPFPNSFLLFCQTRITLLLSFFAESHYHLNILQVHPGCNFHDS